MRDTPPPSVSAKAFAKINLSLRILGKRPDGYHDVETVMVSIGLFDTVSVDARPGPFSIACNDARVPCDAGNLVWRATELAWRAAQRTGPPRDLAVAIEKRIPLQAGLGGGSADAAATIRALQVLWRCRFDPETEREIASKLGADVAFFLDGGTQAGGGRGDRLSPLPDVPPWSIVLVVPPFGVSTADAYRWFDADSRAARSASLDWPSTTEGWDAQLSVLGNDLEGVVAARHPGIADIGALLREAGARFTAMTGSGSAVFGLFESEKLAETAATAVSSRGHGRVWITEPLTAAETQKASIAEK